MGWRAEPPGFGWFALGAIVVAAAASCGGTPTVSVSATAPLTTTSTSTTSTTTTTTTSTTTTTTTSLPGSSTTVAPPPISTSIAPGGFVVVEAPSMRPLFDLPPEWRVVQPDEIRDGQLASSLESQYPQLAGVSPDVLQDVHDNGAVLAASPRESGCAVYASQLATDEPVSRQAVEGVVSAAGGSQPTTKAVTLDTHPGYEAVFTVPVGRVDVPAGILLVQVDGRDVFLANALCATPGAVALTLGVIERSFRSPH
jgi:hypothetical protein